MTVFACCALMLMCIGLAWCGKRANAEDLPAAMVQPAAVSGTRQTGEGAENADGGTVSLPLLLAQVCWLEATFRLTDCAAIHYAIKRRAERAGWPYEKMLTRYSAIDSGTARAQAALALPDGDVPAWTAKQNGAWRNVRDVAAGALAGDVRDPCKGSTGWGGPAIEGDRKRIDAAVASRRAVVVQCDTANVFMREVR
jgi:hypothetical protein